MGGRRGGGGGLVVSVVGQREESLPGPRQGNTDAGTGAKKAAWGLAAGVRHATSVPRVTCDQMGPGRTERDTARGRFLLSSGRDGSG